MICNKTDLLTEEWFMQKKDLDEKCKCEKINTCKAIVALLNIWERKDAEALID